MSATTQQLSLLALVWLAYFTLHSLLASIGLKRRLAKTHPRWMPAYRLVFNLLAVGLLLVPMWLVSAYQAEPLWQWQGNLKIIAKALQYGALIGVLWTFRYYDVLEIAGIRQLLNHEQSVDGQEHFTISPFHRFVRHPWYFLILIYLWTGDMEPAWLLSTIIFSLYFIFGSRLEERKLLAYHGDIYARYMLAVPGLIPLPWRYLSRKEAKELLNKPI